MSFPFILNPVDLPTTIYYNINMNTEESLIDIIKYGKCSCGAAGTELHECPYQYDINNDPNSQCNCCAACVNSCADDI